MLNLVFVQLQGVNSLSEAIQIVSAAGPLLVAGQPIDLNNLRLSLVQRDFGPSDYNTLLALDGSGSLLAPCQCVPEERLASLPTFKHSRSDFQPFLPISQQQCRLSSQA